MHRHRLRALSAAALALSLLVGAAGARAEDRVTRLGVVVAVQVNMTAEEAEALGAAVGEGLREALVIDVVAGGHAARRLPEGGVGELCVARPDCVRDVAARLGADQLLFLVAVKLGSRVQIEPTWASADGERTASREAIVIEEGGRSVREVLAEAAPRLLPAIERRSPASEGAPGVDPAAGAAADPAAGGSSAGGAAVGGGGIAPGEGARGGGIHIGTWIAGGVAVAALAGGVGFGLAARSAESDLEKDGCGTRVTCDEGRIDSLETRMLAADVLYGVAAVSAAAAVVIQWRLGGADEPAPPPVAVTAGPRSIGLAVGGRF